MLWLTLFNRLGKQPMHVTRHNHVKAVIDGKTYELDLKFDKRGEPYLIPRQPKPVKPYLKIYWYDVSRERAEILGSGSQVDWSHRCDTEAEAFEHLKTYHGNTLTRRVKTVDKRLDTQYYDFIEECWYDSRREKLAY